MTWLDFTAYVLATGAILDVWKNGSIFANRRANLEVDAESGSFVGELFTCVYCLSFHVPVWLAGSSAILYWLFPDSQLWRFPVYALAATRASFLLDGLLPAYLSYERKKYVQRTATEPTNDQG